MPKTASIRELAIDLYYAGFNSREIDLSINKFLSALRQVIIEGLPQKRKYEIGEGMFTRNFKASGFNHAIDAITVYLKEKFK